jgi:hypothetical protein
MPGKTGKISAALPVFVTVINVNATNGAKSCPSVTVFQHRFSSNQAKKPHI